MGGLPGVGSSGVKGWPGGVAEAEQMLANRMAGHGLGGRGMTGAGAAGMGAVPGVGTGGYPMMPPPMGGAGAPGGGQERERTTWLVEDEDVWGADPDGLAPTVIGRRD